MQLRADFIVGKQTLNSWAGVYGFKPDDSIEPLELFAIIKLASISEESRLEALAKMFLDEIQNYLFAEGKEGDYIIRMENAVWKMKSKMEVLLSSDERYAQNGLDIEIGLTLFDRNFLYIGVVGESKIFIKRGDRFVELSQGLADGNMMGFLKTGSMELEPGDRLLLCTSNSILKGQTSVEAAVNELNIDKLSTLTSTEGIAALVLAEEKDLWAEKTFQENIVEAPVEDIEEETAGSAKYIPIQEEDFDDHLITPTDIAPEGIDLEVTEDHMDANATSVIEDVYPVEENIDETTEVVNTPISAPSGLVTDLEESVEAIKEMPQGKVMLHKLKNGLTASLELGKNHIGKLSEKIKNRNIDSVNQVNDSEDQAQEEDSDIEVSYSEYEKRSESLSKLSGVRGAMTKVQNFVNTKIVPFFKNSNKTYIKYLRDFLFAIFGLLKRLIKWFKKEFIGGGVEDRRDMFGKARRRKRNRVILIILIVILAILIVTTINNRNAQLAEEARITSIKNSIDSYKTQLDGLVKQVTSNLNDTQKASLLDQLDKLNSNLESQKKDGMYLDSINSQQDTIVKTKDKITGAIGFSQPQIVADLGKQYSDANLTDIVYAQGNLYVTDKARNTIYQIGTNINSEVKQFVTGLSAPYTMTINVDGDIVFFDADSSSSLGKISVADGTITRFTGLSPAVIGNITKAAIFTGNNALYELHQNHQQIYKREQDGATYTAGGAVYNTQNPPNWKTDPELGSAIDIDVPYEIYALVRGKGLRRYLGGEDNTLTKDTFLNTTQKDYDSLSAATAIDIDGKLLAVADPTNRRVLLFTIQDNDAKNLVYEKTFVYRGNDSTIFKNIKEIAVNESSNNIFVLDGTSIIRLDI